MYKLLDLESKRLNVEYLIYNFVDPNLELISNIFYELEEL